MENVHDLNNNDATVVHEGNVKLLVQKLRLPVQGAREVMEMIILRH